VAEISPALYRAGSGEQLVLLHGFTGTWRHFKPLLGDLAARYEVIAPTLSGHAGGPPFPPGTPLTLTGAANLLEAQLDELGVREAHVVGNSMGGALALELAKRGRARSVVALAPGGGWNAGDGEAQRLARYFTRQLRLTRSLERRIGALMRQPNMRHGALRDIMRHGELVAPWDAIDMTRSSLRCSIADHVLAALRADSGVTVHELERIKCPVLLATPEHDRILPPALHAPRFRHEIPGVHARVLLGCGHVPMWDDTPLVLNTIIDFVGRGERARPTAELSAPSPSL
jgi:pimeloyl-ACP methyl ester carboxylesterase